MARVPTRLKLDLMDSAQIDKLLRGGVQPVRVVLRALALRMLDGGASAAGVARCLPFSARAVRDISDRYDRVGLAGAMYDKPRPGARPVLDSQQEEQIRSMVRGDPPEGFNRWTIRLAAREAMARGLANAVGRETIRLLLKNRH